MVVRIVHLGFEVRVDLLDGDGTAFSAQLTRDEQAELELEPGQIVYVTARNGSAKPATPALRINEKIVQ
jgi:ABC-type molybdate transport system ATPase subunit